MGGEGVFTDLWEVHIKSVYCIYGRTIKWSIIESPSVIRCVPSVTGHSVVMEVINPTDAS